MTKLQEIIRRQNDYLLKTGGAWALREADETYNNLNREQLAAFREEHGEAYLGDINFYGDERLAVAAGEKSVYEEYTGQTVCDFGCDFCVPCCDDRLAELIREWNRPKDGLPGMEMVAEITARIEALGGLNFIWY